LTPPWFLPKIYAIPHHQIAGASCDSFAGEADMSVTMLAVCSECYWRGELEVPQEADKIVCVQCGHETEALPAEDYEEIAQDQKKQALMTWIGVAAIVGLVFFLFLYFDASQSRMLIGDLVRGGVEANVDLPPEHPLAEARNEDGSSMAMIGLGGMIMCALAMIYAVVVTSNKKHVMEF
jgi:hypothetical protein